MSNGNLPEGQAPQPEPDPYAVQAAETCNETLEAKSVLSRMQAEIAKAFVGQDEVVAQVLIALLAAGHVLIEGVPGLGKTLLVRALAQTFTGLHGRIQFTPDLMPADIIGHVMYDMQQGQFKIRKGSVFTNLLLADEINRAPAKTQSALLEAMQERQVTLEGKPMALPSPFMTLATQNPIEQEGTYPLPEAQLDRFLLKILITYPSEADESRLVEQVIGGQVGGAFNLSAVAPILKAEGILQLQQVTASLEVDQRVTEYAVKLVRASREWPGVTLGAGPRGSIAVLRASRAQALLLGRDFVIPDDVKSVALPALRHRLLLSPDMEIEGKTTDHVIMDILKTVEAPRL